MEPTGLGNSQFLEGLQPSWAWPQGTSSADVPAMAMDGMDAHAYPQMYSTNQQIPLTDDKKKSLYIVTKSDQSLVDLAKKLKVSGEFVIEASSKDSLARIVSRVKDAVNDSSLDTIHIIGHGGENDLRVGSTTLSQKSISYHKKSLSALAQKLKPGADVLLYGCEIAGNERGKQLVEALSLQLGADVAASTDLTFSDLNRGTSDWELEYQVGVISNDYSDVLTGINWNGSLNVTANYEGGILSIENLTGMLAVSGNINSAGLGTIILSRE